MFCGTAAIAAPAEKPNVLLIYADDMGYNELSCYGGKHVPTPNIDSPGQRRPAFHARLCVGAAVLAFAGRTDDRSLSNPLRPREQLNGPRRIAAH